MENNAVGTVELQIMGNHRTCSSHFPYLCGQKRLMSEHNSSIDINITGGLRGAVPSFSICIITF